MQNAQHQETHKFRFKNKLLSLDSSTISLCLSLFPWAKFRRTKGAVKLHLLLDHDGYLPTFAYISNGKKHDVTIARKVPLRRRPLSPWIGAIMIINCLPIGPKSRSILSPVKDNADYTVIEKRRVPQNRNIFPIN